MAFVYGDRVKETSLSGGLGAMALGGPTLGFQSFAVGVGVANECFYGIVDTSTDEWEMGRGTVGPGTLARDTVISSSSSNLPVILSLLKLAPKRDRKPILHSRSLSLSAPATPLSKSV